MPAIGSVQTPHAVQWIRPESTEDCPSSDWFNIFVLHQNRSESSLFLVSMHFHSALVFICCGVTHFSCRLKANPKNAINEHMLAKFLDFVIWGHEHECLWIHRYSFVSCQFYRDCLCYLYGTGLHCPVVYFSYPC